MNLIERRRPPDIAALREEIERAAFHSRELSQYIAFARMIPPTGWKHSLCQRCGVHGMEILVYQNIPYRLGETAAHMFSFAPFEILDGACRSCGSDTLWPRLCRIDPTRDPSLAAYPCEQRALTTCPRCSASRLSGTWRGTTCTGGYCSACHLLLAPRSVRRVHRVNLATVSRTRRFIERRMQELRGAIFAELVTQAESIPPEDVEDDVG